MPVVTPTGFASDKEIGVTSLITPVDRPNIVPDGLFETPGIRETFFASWQVNSLGGSVAQRLGYWWLTKDEDESSSKRIDMHEKKTQDATLKEYPWLIEDYNSGRMLDIRTPLQRDIYISFRKKERMLAQKAAQGPFLANMGGAIAGDAFLVMAGVKMLTMPRIIGRANKAQATWQLTKTLAGNAAIGATENLIHEGLLQKTKITLTEGAVAKQWEALQWGAVFGAGIPAALSGVGGAGRLISGSKARRMASDVTGSQIQEVTDNAKAFVKQHVEDLTERLEEARKQAPTEPLVVSVLDHPDVKEVESALIEQYGLAGVDIDVREHPQQSMLKIEEYANFVLEQFGSEERVSQLPSGLAGAMSIVSSVRKVNRAGLDGLDLFNMLLDNIIAPKSTDDVLKTANAPSAESMQHAWTNALDNYNLANEKLMADYFNNGGEEFSIVLGDGSSLYIKRGASTDEWGQAIHEYTLQTEEIASGLRTDYSFDAPKHLKQSAELRSALMVESLEKMDDAGVLGGPKALEAQSGRRGVLQSQLAAHQSAIESRGQTIGDLTSGPGGKAAKEANATIGRIEEIPTNERTLQDNLELEEAQRTFDDIQQTKRFERPGATDDALDEINETVKRVEGMPLEKRTVQDSADLAEAKKIIAEGTETRKSLDEANATIERIEAIDKAERTPAQDAELEQAIETRVQTLKRPGGEALLPGELSLKDRRALQKELREVEDSIDVISDRMANGATYINRVWKSDVIKNDKPNYIATLVAQYRQNRRTRKGRLLAPANRRIRQGALDEVEDFKLSDGRDASDVMSDFFTEGEFDKIANAADQQALRDAYEVAIEKYYAKSAEDVFTKLTNAETAHGVEGVHGNNFIKERGLDIDTRRFTKYLEQNARRQMDKYIHNISGRTSVAQALRLHEVKYGQLTKKYLDEAPDFTVEQWRRTMAAHLQLTRDASSAIAQHTNNPAHLRRANSIINGAEEIANHKVDELIGRVETGNLAQDAAWARPLLKIAMKLPFLGYMGGMLLSSIPDMAAVMTMTGWTPRKVRQIGRALIPFTEFDRRGLEIFAATGDEMASSRTMRLYDVDSRSGDIRTSDGTAAAVTDWVDQRTDWAAKKMLVWSGMNWWNRNLKRAVAHQFTQESLDVMKKMHKIQNELDALKAKSGVDASPAQREALFAKHKLRIEDAKRYNQIGINAARAKRFLRNTYEVGEFSNGKKLNEMSFDEFLDDKTFTYLEAGKWAKTDRRLFDIYTSGINRLINSTIVDPNLLSRPGFNRTAVGKIFNQFWTFAYAFGTQSIPLAQQQGGVRFASFMGTAMGMGLLTETLKNELAGRQTIAEAAKQLAENPHHSLLRAFDRAGLGGPIARLLPIVERVPIVEKMLGGAPSSKHGHQIINPIGLAGVLPDYMARGLLHGVSPFFGGSGDPKKLIKMAPFLNLSALQAIKRYMFEAGIDSELPESMNGIKFQTLEGDWAEDEEANLR